jgi:protein tyrosine/serine phosphatase
MKPIEGSSTNSNRLKLNKTSFRRVVTLCLLVFVLILTSYLYWAHVDYRLLTIVEDNLFRSAEMPPNKLVDFVKERHINTVIDFRTTIDSVYAEKQALISNGIQSIHIPSELVPSDEAVNSFLDVMEDASNYPILFHCEHGIGRSSLFEAIYRIEFMGWSNEDARKSARLRSLLGSFESHDIRGQYLLNYQRHNKRVRGLQPSDIY